MWPALRVLSTTSFTLSLTVEERTGEGGRGGGRKRGRAGKRYDEEVGATYQVRDVGEIIGKKRGQVRKFVQ